MTAWIVAGWRAPSYSPVDDAISRLAAGHAPTRVVMTVGFVLFGLGVPLFAVALRAALGGPAWLAAVAAGVSTLAVAAFPLDTGVDGLHAASAVTGYACLAATPLLAAGPLAANGSTALARASTFTGAISATLLATSLIGPAHGMLQRAGLGATDLWICAASVALLRSRSDPFVSAARRPGHGPPPVGRGCNG